MSVNALAKHAEVAQSVLWRILEGERRATVATGDRIAEALESWGADAIEAAKELRRAVRAQGRTQRKPRRSK